MADADKRSTSRLFAAVREAQDQSLRLADNNEHARARARLLQAIDEVDAGTRAAATPKPAPSRAPWRWGLGGLAAAACALAIVWALPGDELEFEVDGVEIAQDTRIVASEYTRTLEFSDDTTIALAPGSAMRLHDLRSNGATVSLEAGEVDLAVHHEDDTSWRVDAGPWSVHVTGTQFSVAWEPSSEYFRVAVTEGSVRVEGPEGEIANLRGGDAPLVRMRGKATIEPEPAVDSEGPEVAALDIDEPAVDAPDPSDAEVEIGDAREHEHEHDQKPAAKAPSWKDDFDDADYEAAWQALEDRSGGVRGVAETADASTLLDLADLARYTKHSDDARFVLEQLRERHAGTKEASEAAFALGRLAAQRGDAAKAADYFEVYLDERQNGTHAEDALGRLLDVYAELGKTKDAASAARRYLDLFPQGPRADKAGKLLAK